MYKKINRNQILQSMYNRILFNLGLVWREHVGESIEYSWNIKGIVLKRPMPNKHYLNWKPLFPLENEGDWRVDCAINSLAYLQLLEYDFAKKIAEIYTGT